MKLLHKTILTELIRKDFDENKNNKHRSKLLIKIAIELKLSVAMNMLDDYNSQFNCDEPINNFL